MTGAKGKKRACHATRALTDLLDCDSGDPGHADRICNPFILPVPRFQICRQHMAIIDTRLKERWNHLGTKDLNPPNKVSHFLLLEHSTTREQTAACTINVLIPVPAAAPASPHGVSAVRTMHIGSQRHSEPKNASPACLGSGRMHIGEYLDQCVTGPSLISRNIIFRSFHVPHHLSLLLNSMSR